MRFPILHPDRFFLFFCVWEKRNTWGVGYEARWSGRLIIVVAPPNVSNWPIARSMLASRLTTDRSPDATSNLPRPRKISQPRAQGASPVTEIGCHRLSCPKNRAQPMGLRLVIRPKHGGLGGTELAGYYLQCATPRPVPGAVDQRRARRGRSIVGLSVHPTCRPNVDITDPQSHLQRASRFQPYSNGKQRVCRVRRNSDKWWKFVVVSAGDAHRTPRSLGSKC